MNDDKTQVGGPTPGDTGLPNQDIDAGMGDSGLSDAATQALVERIVTRLGPEIDRKVQSVKDKRLSKVDKIEESLSRLGVLAELEEHGVTIPSDLKMEMRLKELEARLNQGASPDLDAGTSTVTANADTARVLDELKLDASDPEVLRVLSGAGDVTLGLAKLAVRRVTAPSPTPEQAAASIGKPLTPPDGNALIGEYKTKVLANKGNANAIRAIKEQYRQKGVPVDQVDVTR